jgi:hypothetical protein
LIIEHFEYFCQEILLDRIRRVHLKGRPGLDLYRNARISLWEGAGTDEIVFAQYYVLEKDLAEIADCRRALLEYGVDIFRLKGFVRVHSRREEDNQLQVFDVLPPVVEISAADGGIPLLNDGMHRLYLAREAGSPINVVKVEGADPAYPYYALPNEGGWGSLMRCTEVPDVKKNYRVKDYKSLFRDFNTAFLGVTQARTAKVPATLQVQGQKVPV